MAATEQEHCASSMSKYCDAKKSPVYSFTSSKLCVVAHFMKIQENKRSFCQSIFEPYFILPQASQIIDGLWFAAT